MRTIPFFFFLILIIIVFIIPAVSLLHSTSQASEQLSLKRSADLLKITVNHLYDEGSCSIIILTIPENRWIIGYKNNIYYGESYTAYHNVSTLVPAAGLEKMTRSGSYKVCLFSEWWNSTLKVNDTG